MVAEVLYTTLGMPLFGLDDVELQQICFSVFNDWLGEYCLSRSQAALSGRVDFAGRHRAGVKELERCAKMGFKGAMIWGAPPEDKPYSKAIYDPFWAAAQETSMPISLHVITQKKQNEIKFDGPRTGRPDTTIRSSRFSSRSDRSIIWRRAGAFSRTQDCLRRE